LLYITRNYKISTIYERAKGISFMDPAFEFVFPVIRGIQAGREYYVSMCPLRLISKIFSFDEEEVVSPELRAQRSLNKARIPIISRYITENPTTYVFSAITASIDGKVRFEPLGDNPEQKRVGLLHIQMEATKFIINDGQHRRAAIDAALRERPELADETIAVVFFLDIGAERCQQMFADLNRYAIRPSKSLGVLYDHQEEHAILAKLVMFRSKVFKDYVEKERSTLSPRSRKLFTLSSIYFATRELLEGIDGSLERRADIATNYWEEVAKMFLEWSLVIDRKMTSSEVRRDFIHSHGISLQALGRLGNVLLKENPSNWKQKIKKLKAIDWSRSNSRLWEGRAMIGGRISKAHHNIILTTNVLKNKLGIQLTPGEQRVEDAFLRGDYGQE
jgi:DNA sulfur modification protein DndB